MALNPTLLLGARLNNQLFEHRLNNADGVSTVVLSMKSNRLAPAGVGGNCAFRALFFAVRYQMQQSLLVSAWVDDVQIVTDYLAILPTLSSVQSKTVEVPLSVPVLLDAIEVGRERPQGVWIQVQVTAPAQELLAIDGVDVEYDVIPRRF